jgi:hypothetical protein
MGVMQRKSLYTKAMYHRIRLGILNSKRIVLTEICVGLIWL